MIIDRAAELLNVSVDSLKYFEMWDGFNPGNQISGYLCYRPDHRYGALVIFKVNEENCEQIIYGTPKMHYPFDKNGKFNWPDVTEMQIWEKIDGTNILAYHYTYKNLDFVTYKTRLTPIVKDMQFGKFESMWNELLEMNLWIKKTISENSDYNLSFELYGDRNPITIKYTVPLATALLFGVRRSDGAIKPPTELKGFRESPMQFNYNPTTAWTEMYRDLRNFLTNANEIDGELRYEGIVFYAHVGEASWRQFKCKPEQIEKIHWSAGGISNNAVWTTALNAFESYDNPTIEDLKQLLLEEFTDTQITKSWNKIQRLFKEAYNHTKFVALVNDAWLKAREQGFDVTKDKGATMRFLSQFFSKQDMRKVGTIVLQQAGLLNKN